ncbi:MAG: tRNA (N(6)-L-threonylcarbamoyladenosine(37)-C(2))-methylthiotransferase MtaB [Clostridia bacterium]|nr:tRNA (N(6)-L-threonylcarbamoyladenosine(37)-C(2))-methylthiotransferase MtaB [Clostridia bacterium]
MDKREFKVGIHTLGCKVSQYESAAIKEKLEERGYSVCAEISGCDVIIINTCTVTVEADRKCASFIRRAAKAGAKVIVCGCYSQINGENIEKSGVVYFCGTAGKMSAVDAVDAIYNEAALPSSKIEAPDAYGFEDMKITEFDRTRAYIKIEDGCDSHCSYCIIPKARGRVRSKHTADVLKEAEYLVENGCKEIVLTGIEVDAWGKDLDEGNLTDLLESVDAIEGDFRIRLGSLDPFFITEDFAIRASRLKKLAPHFHLSVQSASSSVLRLMKRRYNAEKLNCAVELLKKHIDGVMFTCDIIVGFPGETEDDLLQTCEFCERVGFINMHVFPYSERPGTVASTLSGSVPVFERKSRVRRLTEIRDRVKNEAVSQKISKNKTHRVLVETKTDEGYFAHGGDFVEFLISADELDIGTFVNVSVDRVENGCCFCSLCDKS